jgi:hypothetical protein
MSEFVNYLHNFRSRTEGFHQFRLIKVIKGVEFGSRVLTYRQMVELILDQDLNLMDIDKIVGRRAGSGLADWEVI